MANSDGPDDWIELPPLTATASAASGPDDWQELPPKRPEKGVAETMMRGAAQGATFGFADEATAALGAAKDVATGNVPTGQAFDRPGFTGYLKDLKDKYGNAYASYIDKIRGEDAKAKSDNPWTYGLSEVGGALGSTAVGPGAALAPVKGAGMLGNAARIGAQGAVTGAGLTEAPPTSPQFYKDAAFGAGTSLATAGALKAGGAAIGAMRPQNLARKSANVLLNTPEEITDTYIKNPEGVRNASTRFEVAQRYKDLLEKLKGYVTGGSAESRAILSQEGKTIPSSELSKIYGAKADEILSRAEGRLGDDPQKLAAYNWLREQEQLFMAQEAQGPRMPGAATPTYDQPLSTNRVKDNLQALDRQTEYGTGPGQFARIDDTVKGDVRHATDRMLKDTSPAYEQQMKGVASDAALLSEAQPLANNDGTLANVFRRLETDKYGGGQAPRATLEEVDQRMGSDILEQAKLAHAKEAFDKSVTNGSRNVNFYSNLLNGIPGAKYAAPIIGGTVDKYGRKMTMAAVDSAAALERTWQREGIQKFVSDVRPIVDAASRGDAGAALTMQLLEKYNPHAARAARAEGAPQP